MEYFTFILGLIVGSLIVLIFHHRITASGELLIDHTDPEKDIYRPAAWNAFGMDKEGADLRACKNYGPLYK